MLTRIRHYFRGGHVSMTPGMKPGSLVQGVARKLVGQNQTRCVFPWHITTTSGSNTSSPSDSQSDAAQKATYGVDTYNGSAAIAAALKEADLNEDDEVLLPAYCCGAELGPFNQIGCTIRFYDVREDLSVNREQIDRCLSNYPQIRMLFITHYFGIAQPDTADLARWCDDQKIIFFEDCAHALYSKIDNVPLGSFGHYSIFSPRKTLPVTEGGRLVSREALSAVSTLQTRRDVPLLPRLSRLCYALQQGGRSRTPGWSVSNIMAVCTLALATLPAVVIKLLKRMDLVRTPDWLTPDVEGEDAVPVYDIGISAHTRRIYQSSNAQQIVDVRRRNFHQWLECTSDCELAKPLITTLPKGSCPLYFPVVVRDPAVCVASLARFDIEAFNWWQHTPPELEQLDPGLFPVARRLKSSIVALPLHQDISCRQIEAMAKQLKRAV